MRAAPRSALTDPQVPLRVSGSIAPAEIARQAAKPPPSTARRRAPRYDRVLGLAPEGDTVELGPHEQLDC